MVAVGVTVFDVVPKTEPTELSMDNVVGTPPVIIHESVADWPTVMVAGVAVKVEMIGARGLTVTVADCVTVPETLLAVMV